MSQIAIVRPVPALKGASDSGHRADFVTSPMAKDGTILLGPPEKVTDGTIHYERPLGDSELSYYLPSRASGVNDM
jgi:hypothetical protein